jgi:hypothetical protein
MPRPRRRLDLNRARSDLVYFASSNQAINQLCQFFAILLKRVEQFFWDVL